jgi:hypothetical protein
MTDLKHMITEAASGPSWDGNPHTAVSGGLVGLFASAAQLGFSLVPAEDGDPVIATFGGQPNVPADFSWPHRRITPLRNQRLYHDQPGSPLAFAAELNLSELTRVYGPVEGAQLHGRLLVFVSGNCDFEIGHFIASSPDQRPDSRDRDDYRIVHVADTAPTSPLSPPPDATVYRQTRMTAKPVATIPTTNVGEDELIAAGYDEASSEHHEALWELADLLDTGSRHQLLGWPMCPSQRDPRWACPAESNDWWDMDAERKWLWDNEPDTPDESDDYFAQYQAMRESGRWLRQGTDDPWATKTEADWKMLACLNSDDSVGWMWGDDGEVYLMIRADDLAAGRFDRVVLTFQCA